MLHLSDTGRRKAYKTNNNSTSCASNLKRLIKKIMEGLVIELYVESIYFLY